MEAGLAMSGSSRPAGEGSRRWPPEVLASTTAADVDVDDEGDRGELHGIILGLEDTTIFVVHPIISTTIDKYI